VPRFFPSLWHWAIPNHDLGGILCVDSISDGSKLSGPCGKQFYSFVLIHFVPANPLAMPTMFSNRKESHTHTQFVTMKLILSIKSSNCKKMLSFPISLKLLQKSGANHLHPYIGHWDGLSHSSYYNCVEEWWQQIMARNLQER
jgi:hypothetical protein